VRGAGTIYAYTIMYHTGDKRFAASVPYASIIVELDAAPGALLAGNLLGAPYTQAKVGRRVEVVFEPLNNDITRPACRLVGAAPAEESMFHWLSENPPQLFELRPKEQRRVWKAANYKMYRHWQMWLAIPGAPLSASVGVALAGRIDDLIGLGIGRVILYLTIVNLLPPRIREVLAEKDSQPL